MSEGVWYVAGPTGVGKSTVALEVAEAVGAEIVNADAFQLYRGLEVLTAAPTLTDRTRVPHHLYGVLEPETSCDAAAFAIMARNKLAELAARRVRALVVGGSGLYLKALTHGLSDLPSDPGVRASLAEQPLARKVDELRRLDPVGAAAMNLSNERYVDRALEICRLTGRPASVLRRQWAQGEPRELQGVVLERNRGDLYRRIDGRVTDMLENGAVQEVASLAAAGRKVAPTVEKAIGWREVCALLSDDMTLADAATAIQAATRRYAKRQMTWFRRERWLKTICLEVDTTPHSAASAIVRTLFS